MTEIEKLLTMNYEDVCQYFKNKYGNVPKNYFANEKCKSKSTKITRGKEGLYIHHIDENKIIMLSTPEIARRAPFEYQKADRLIYCNLLEHFLLHVKLIEYFGTGKGVGGVYDFIGPELNDIYSGIKYEQPWRQKVTEVVLPLKEDYFKCLKKLKEVSYPPYPNSSHNEKYGIWKNENNRKLYREINEYLFNIEWNFKND